MKFYLIIDNQNKIVKDFKNKSDAESYVETRPYLRVKEFDPDECNSSTKPHVVDPPDDLPF